MRFTDIIYGSIELPDWLTPFLKIPEFVRLRGVRLSNVDSYEFKDFSGPTRWEHCIGVTYLAMKYAQKKNLNELDAIYLMLAALLHDVATPPFAHTVEYVIEGYDHELESNKILSPKDTNNQENSIAIFASHVPKFEETCKKLSKKLGRKIDPAIVADLVVGNGPLGFLINGSIDLDNIDNVTRASIHLGIDVNRKVPLHVVEWLTKFEEAPLINAGINDVSVLEWIGYKNQMYSLFFNSSEEELGRQAFLQHMIRRVYNEGLSRNSIVWSTDEGLLFKIENFSEKYKIDKAKNIFNYSISLTELVQRYRLLEMPYKTFEINVDDQADFKIVKQPAFASWLEDQLTTTTFEPFILINSKRYSTQGTLFNKDGGIIQVYKLGDMDLKIGQIPSFIKDRLSKNEESISRVTVNKLIGEKIKEGILNRPWLNLTEKRKDSVKANLDNMGNWSFRQSRNESLHSYPATFVHTIPAALINCLGLKGELILDPFGGTGQTGLEAIKFGGTAITSDSNSIATLVSKVKFSYLSNTEREYCNDISDIDLMTHIPIPSPSFDRIFQWHHPKTITELCHIKGFIDSCQNEKLKDFFTVCFSDILTSCTARKGKEHGFFADNTPLSKGEFSPPYENAIKLFLLKIKKNITVLERIYSYFDKNGLDVAEELSNVKVIQRDITNTDSLVFDVAPQSVSGIITSPPYLCMVDYTLGQRLSYEWLFPEMLKLDFVNEIGSRRSRMQNEKALDSYLSKMRYFAKNSACLLRQNGILATVIGAPVANNYKDKNVISELDKIFKDEGFELLWETQRPISWHRNHGYARLKEERIAVHVKA